MNKSYRNVALIVNILDNYDLRPKAKDSLIKKITHTEHDI